MTITLVSINSGCIAELSDDTFWRIAPLDLKNSSGWEPGIEVVVEPNDTGKLWSSRLVNVRSGVSVGALPSSRLSR